MFFLWAACRITPSQQPVDVVGALGPDEVRAWTVTDEHALFGGVSAEGAAGDIKLYNDRARFVIQGIRESNYDSTAGGQLIDADVVRPEGEVGRDVLDEMDTMVGLGRVFAPESIEVLSNGLDGEAVVRVKGGTTALGILVGALENADFIPPREASITQDYKLRPGSPLLEIDTTVEWHDVETPLQVGDILIVGQDVTRRYWDGAGFGDSVDRDVSHWSVEVGRRDEVVLGLFSGLEDFDDSAATELLSGIGPPLAGFGPAADPVDGDVLHFDRFVGVSDDLAALTAAWNTARGTTLREVGGLVEADGHPVAGARVHLLDGEDLPRTMTTTDVDGRWSAQVPSDVMHVAVSGRGDNEGYDEAPGAGWTSPYEAGVVADAELQALEKGAPSEPFAEGYGVSAIARTSDASLLQLTAPGTLQVHASDGLPLTVRVEFADGDPVAGVEAFAPERPNGWAAHAVLRDGDGDIALEPGKYKVIAHRGPRWSAVESDLQIDAGEVVPLEVALQKEVSTPGFLVGDPHCHAAPSTDGGISMPARLVDMAAYGVDVHFATDHDHIVDYRPLLRPLGLDRVLASIVGEEVSPVIRGHMNVYPLDVAPQAFNHGAFVWWAEVLDTDTLLGDLHGLGSDPVVQVNHARSSGMGMLNFAGYDRSTGVVSTPDHFSQDFDAFEVLNAGSWTDIFEDYLDFTSRGFFPTPVGSSDTHTYHGAAGRSFTWFAVPSDDVSALAPDDIRADIADGSTVASNGPFLDVRNNGVWAPGATFDGPVTLQVGVLTPSWMIVDTLAVYRDGALEQTLPISGTKVDATVLLDPEADAVYVLTVSGAAAMSPVFPNDMPWAMASAIRVDRDGNGWTAPKAGISSGP